jgi:hypothetical protein
MKPLIMKLSFALLALWGVSNGDLFAQAPVLEVRQPVQKF